MVTAPSKPKPEPVKATDKDRPNPDSLPKAKQLVNVSSSADEVPHAIPIKSLPNNVEDQPPAPKPTVKSHVEDSPPAKPKTETKAKSDDAKPKKSTKTDKSESKTTSKTDKSSKDKESSGKHTHVVGSKETLYSISKKFGVSVSALQKANGIKDPTQLRDGTKLIIPSKSKDKD